MNAGTNLTVCFVALLVFGCTVQSESPSRPTTKIDRLIDDFETAMQQLSDRYAAAQNDAERQQVYETDGPNIEAVIAQLSAAAKETSDPDQAYKALAWIVDKHVHGQEGHEAVKVISEQFTSHKDIGKLLQSISNALPSKTIEQLLSSVAEKHPDRKTRGFARYAKAIYLTQLKMFQVHKGSEALLGTENSAYVNAKSITDEDIVAIYQEIVDDYGDITSRAGNSLADMSENAIFEIQHLQIGKPAPEIEGEDIDGVQFKLSDFRGKVVYLSFWGHW